MRAHAEVMSDNKVDGSCKLRVYVSERREGFFVLQPIGSINTNTSPILQNEVEQILESEPEIILFDMKHVDYINSQGLSVILKVQQALKLRGGKVVLINFQPHIKIVFDIIKALPKQRIFENRHELDNYLDTMQDRYSDYSYTTEFEAGMDNYIIWAESNSYQGIDKHSRMEF